MGNSNYQEDSEEGEEIIMQMQRRLVVDGQVFQTAAWHRGMGKYSLELLAALDKLNQKKSHWKSLTILFSDELPEEADL